MRWPVLAFFLFCSMLTMGTVATSPSAAQGVRTEPIVWVDGASLDDGRAMFPNRVVNLIQKTVSGPEWEVPDAVLFGPTRAAAAERNAAALLAAGTEVVVQSDTRPAGPWAWQQTPTGWHARVAIVGPNVRVDGRVYDAVDLRPIGRTARQRQQVVMLVGLFVLAAIGASLLRGKSAVWGVVGVTAIASGGLFFWGRANTTLLRDRVTVVVLSDAFAQVDEWTFERSPQRLRTSVVPAEAGWPVLRSAQQAQQAGMTVGPTEIAYDIAPQRPMVLLRRELHVNLPVPAELKSIDTPLRRLAGLYTSRSVTPLGVQRAADDGAVLWLRRAEVEANDAR
jgi:hypothetical protein